MADDKFNATPNNLPTGSNATPSGSQGFANEPDDMFAEVDREQPAQQPVRRPAPAMPTPPAPARPASVPVPAAPRPQSQEPMLARPKKILVAVVILLLLFAALAFGGWYGYNTFVKNGDVMPGTTNTVTNTPPSNVPSVNENANPVVNENTNTNVVAPEVDTDSDGLSDEEERLYGTNIELYDSDNDMLTDRDEVKVFKTDPNISDTDGDGFIDGQEVRNGFDPKGPGKLSEQQ